MNVVLPMLYEVMLFCSYICNSFFNYFLFCAAYQKFSRPLEKSQTTLTEIATPKLKTTDLEYSNRRQRPHTNRVIRN